MAGGTHVNAGEVTCGTCGISTEIPVKCACDGQQPFLLTTSVKHYIGEMAIFGPASMCTVSVVGDFVAAGVYLLNSHKVHIARVDAVFVAFSSSGHFPMNLEGFSFKFIKYMHAHNKSRRFLMQTIGHPILDNRAECQIRRENYFFVTEIKWSAGPVNSICIFRWASMLGNNVEQVDTVKRAV